MESESYHPTPGIISTTTSVIHTLNNYVKKKKKNPFLSNETLQHWNQRYHFCFVSMDASFDLSDVPTSHLIREMQRRLRCEQVPDTRTILIGKSNSTEKKKTVTHASLENEIK